eukprot:CAMPEP_0114412120 /NCGR_PEP_ID=MMETSP0103-20121206/154_1 /TAXON_ID=37642 ORGANISM="Paraphysomonas imperforata, Strain PA2" /NCGR_SAMPLE_ID=MMETSP0103 /ASSEMBLY_ACC=CAM_ASM_000201 /LENGTH=31 /DNA_ID= /DNA_START= /DNA_END= /DNA_ORIENTATION=
MSVNTQTIKTVDEGDCLDVDKAENCLFRADL